MYKLILSPVLLWSLLASALPAQIEQPRVDVTVRFEPNQASPGDKVTLVIEGLIEPGYHLYGKKQGGEPSFVISPAKNPNLRAVGTFQVPDGELHSDPDFPTLKHYWLQDEVAFRQTFEVAAAMPAGEITFTGTLVYEACTEEMCDPQFSQPITAKLQVQQGSVKPPPSRHIGNHQQMEVIKPAKVKAGETVKIQIRTEMEPGWHNYGSTPDPEGISTPTTMTFQEYPGNVLKPVGKANVPPGHMHEADGMITHELTDEWVMSQELKVPEGTKPGQYAFVFEVAYMACDEAMCDAPVTTKLGGTLLVEAGAARGAVEVGTKQEPVNIAEEEVSALTVIAYLLGAIGAGLFALIMPCTYPMIPITISFFTKQAEIRGGSVLPLALLYGAGIVGSFVLVGVLVAFSGVDMQKVATNGGVNIVLAGLFVYFALSLFGIVELKPPAFLMNTAGKASGVGGPMGVFLMGGTLCISSFACTAPFLGTMLAAGSSTGSKTLMLVGMGVFGLTMALPFVILSLVPGRLPRSGGWMNTAKIIFGFIELAAALKFFSITDVSWHLQMLPRELFLTIWAGLFGICGLYTLGFIKFKGETGEIGGGRLVTGSAIVVFAFYCMHGAMGYRLDNEVMLAFEPPYTAETVGSRTGFDGQQSTGGAAMVGAGGPAMANSGGHTVGKMAGHLVIKDDFDAAVKVAIREQKLLLVNFTGYN
jgi:thiol:disulfide interchange protein